ncbi:hypothetical protein ACLOJK_017201 [Asimina triloba]
MVAVPEQLNSVKKFLELDFELTVPGFQLDNNNNLAGRGRRIEFKDIQDKNAALEALLANKEQVYVKKVQNKEQASAQ